MGTIRLPSDFREFLKLLNFLGVDYYFVGADAGLMVRYPALR